MMPDSLRRAGRSAGAPVVMAIVASLAIAACGATTPSGTPPTSSASVAPTASASLAPSPTPPASVAPTPVPTASPSPAPIVVDSVATVVTDDLRVRSKPGVSADSKELEPLLDRGRDVYVVAGPVAASGYTWYEVEPLRVTGDVGDLPFGWVASSDKGGETWVSGAGPACPSVPDDFDTVVSTYRLTELACFRGQDISFDARLGRPEATCGADSGWTVKPLWLGDRCPQPKFLIANTANDESIYPILKPGLKTSQFHPGTLPATWIDVTVTGHFDDPAAKTCRGVSTEAGIKVPFGRAQIILDCRSTFVVSNIAKR